MRIAGIDIPDNKRGEIALTYIYGLGRSSAIKILKEAVIIVDDEDHDRLLARPRGGGKAAWRLSHGPVEPAAFWRLPFCALWTRRKTWRRTNIAMRSPC